MELTSEAMFIGVLPFSTNNLEGDILIGRTSNETQNLEIRLPFTGRSSVGGRLGHIDEIGIEDVEFVALDNLGWWIIQVVVSLIVFIPHKTGVNAIEETRFTRTILVGPQEGLIFKGRLNKQRESIKTFNFK